MTALAGFWAFGGGDPAAACARMVKTQAIYGPDGTAQRAEGEIALGRALFRILPEDGVDRGPVSGGGGRLLLVADARIDNRAEIESALGIAASEAARLAEPMLMMRAFERWGTAAAERFVGDFAFALWDSAERRLVLGRDYLGMRPLHFHRGRDFLAFASMPKGLHVLPDVPYAVHQAGIAAFLAGLPETETETFFDGIDKVAPGHLVTLTADACSTRRFWTPPPGLIRLSRPEDYVEALREKMDEAVAARLRGGNGRLGAQLSAGLDSAGVTATAARLLDASGDRVTAFTAVPEPGFDRRGLPRCIPDEGALAAATAALYPNIEHVLVRAGGRSPFEALDRNFFLYERPYPNICNEVWLDAINDAAKERRLKILLDGQMGNMGFSWTGLTSLAEQLGGGRLLALAGTARALRRNGTRWGTIASQSIGPYLPESWWKALMRLRGKGRELADYSMINLQSEEGRRVFARAAGQGLDLSYRPRRNGAAARLWALGRIDFGNYQKGLVAGWGIDARDPTADRRLIEFCLTVPEDVFLYGGRQRGLARAAMADRLPAEVAWLRLKGYQGADWHLGVAAGFDRFEEEMERISATSGAARAVDVERMRAMMAEWPAEGFNEVATIQRYRGALLRGVSTGHFVRKASGGNS